MIKNKNSTNQDWTSGIGLISLGVFFLLVQNGLFAQFSDGSIVLPLLAIGFVGWGIISKEAGLFVPGGIFVGISLGALLLESSLTQYVAEDGGLFMIGFALGWVSISLFTAVFQHKIILWPFIPASIIGFIGISVAFGGWWLMLLATIGKGWPLLLVILGIYLLWENTKTTKAKEL